MQRRYNQYLLIVTEGSKTEPLYFTEMINFERLYSAWIEVTPGEYGNNPMSVINYALDRKKENKLENKRHGEPKYDAIYCVIDRDDHPNFNDAYIKGISNGLKIIRSIPCFEIWFLLHFIYSTKIYVKRNNLYRTLRKFIPNYAKGKSCFNQLWAKKDTALKNAILLVQAQRAITDIVNEHPNPFTEVHILVNDLLKQKVV